MDEKDKELLNLIQRNFPVHSRPYMILAERLQITEDEVIDRVKKLKANGHIRKLGGVFNSKKLGYHSTLCALKAPADRIPEISKVINSYKGVTHNYIRDHTYNMWFTLMESSQEALESTINEIKEKTRVDEILSLQAENVFKINVNFQLTDSI
ncbi:AsnC family transcriptional regulator [Clostridium aminobutyricum]|uniref:siroheme decarboxylase n=1 Tax=Clostridium aminobutyricum TaxID=33953 RepID=A0A939D6E6_CLOAM|nr:AsnC family transcriptional regulator [Clostridium aminobutyricum]MBN7771945.1 AsnC family transcriptional regulator [Clostridium aminobutyricum]